MKKLTKDAAGKGAKGKDSTKLMQEKEAEMKETIVNLEEDFFKKVSEGDDINAIMARGELKEGAAAGDMVAEDEEPRK